MLEISTKQYQAFKIDGENQFRHDVVAQYLNDPPAVLLGVPIENRKQVVENCFDWAFSCGLDWRSSVATFMHLMLTVAPDFFQKTLIQDCLIGPAPDRNRRFNDLIPRLSDRTWVYYQSRASYLPLFIHPTLLSDNARDNVWTALHNVLPECVSESMHEEIFLEANRESERWKINDCVDADLVLAAGSFLYSQSDQPFLQSSWAKELLRKQWPSHLKVSAFRLHIAQTFQRTV